MGERITVIGGSDSTVAVTLDGSQALSLAQQFVDELDNYYSQNKLNFMSVTDSPTTVSGEQGYGVITKAGSYSAGNGYDYIVVGGYNEFSNGKPLAAADSGLLNGAVTINSAMSNSSQFVRVIGGNLGGFTYNAGAESGQLAAGNADSNVTFNGQTLNGGSWDIRTGNGNDTIVTGSGDNTVQAGNGNNSINITSGTTNSVISDGIDTITASSDSTAINSITLVGGQSATSHSVVNVNSGASVMDYGYYNTVTVGGGSTITGSGFGNYNFDGSTASALSVMQGGVNSTITATGDVQIIQGDTNTITASKTTYLLNPSNATEASVSGPTYAFGSDGLDLTLNVAQGGAGLFSADAGNETLNASGSTGLLMVYANTVVGGGTNLVATGGSGNDTLIGGTGNSTFTGGAGNNTFQFDKTSSTDGNTVITDFAKAGSSNKISLYNFGLDSDSLAALLKSSSNDANGDAVLKLTGHTITIEGVAVSDLTTSQFDVANPASKGNA